MFAAQLYFPEIPNVLSPKKITPASVMEAGVGLVRLFPGGLRHGENVCGRNIGEDFLVTGGDDNTRAKNTLYPVHFPADFVGRGFYKEGLCIDTTHKGQIVFVLLEAIRAHSGGLCLDGV